MLLRNALMILLTFGFMVHVGIVKAQVVDQRGNMHSFVPKSGFVPDENTAVAVAEAILVPIYGGDKIAQQKPFIASLSNGIWTIEGTLPVDSLGGVFLIKISQKDARVLRVTHGK